MASSSALYLHLDWRAICRLIEPEFAPLRQLLTHSNRSTLVPGTPTHLDELHALDLITDEQLVEISRLFTIMSTTLFLDWSSGKPRYQLRPLFSAAYDRHRQAMPTPAIKADALLETLSQLKKRTFPSHLAQELNAIEQVVDHLQGTPLEHILPASLRGMMTTATKMPLPEQPSAWDWVTAHPCHLVTRFKAQALYHRLLVYLETQEAWERVRRDDYTFETVLPVWLDTLYEGWSPCPALKEYVLMVLRQIDRPVDVYHLLVSYYLLPYLLTTSDDQLRHPESVNRGIFRAEHYAASLMANFFVTDDAEFRTQVNYLHDLQATLKGKPTILSLDELYPVLLERMEQD